MMRVVCWLLFGSRRPAGALASQSPPTAAPPSPPGGPRCGLQPGMRPAVRLTAPRYTCAQRVWRGVVDDGSGGAGAETITFEIAETRRALLCARICSAASYHTDKLQNNKEAPDERDILHIQ